MPATVRELAELVQGEVLGDGGLPIAGARPLSDARPGDITFVDGPRHLRAWDACPAAAAVVLPAVAAAGRPVIRVADPVMAFARIFQHFHTPLAPDAPAIDPTAHVHPSARIGAGVTAGPFAVVGAGSEVGANATIHAGAVVGRGCRVGADAVLHPRVVLYDGCRLGDRVVVHANAVIGADGFGYRSRQDRHVKVPQLGWVEIDADVEIGAGTTIDRGTFGPTRVGAGTKIDNLVQVGHNCQIGRHNLIVSQVGIAGSVVTGDYVVMAGQSGAVERVRIGDRAVVGAQSGVLKDVPADARVLGFPARPAGPVMRVYAALEELPTLAREVKRLKPHPGGADG